MSRCSARAETMPLMPHMIQLLPNDLGRASSFANRQNGRILRIIAISFFSNVKKAIGMNKGTASAAASSIAG
jgi:hypothetical protein